MGGTPKVHVLSTDLVTVNGLSLLGNGNLEILNGKSAYELYGAVLGEGVTPLTEAEWILSLKGDLSPINSAIENINNSLENKLDKSGGATSGPIIGLKEKVVTMPNGTLDLNEGNLFTKTVTSNTTFTLTNISAIPNVVQSFILEITNGGNFIVTWWNNIKWDSGEIPELTENGVDILGFYTSDNGNTWRGVLLSKDSK